ncbi:BatD family protein [Lacinutrix jangbogonensis]|uniref:BatD family protein n=1 Tax=Lacinutrix jangbogonensis TaxID=1469557 RepID=UPI00053E4880|nr:BatD family protein [Lacinutrix jangbogonensis]
MVKRFYILATFYLIASNAFGQGLMSYVTLNKNNPYIGEPVQLKVHVYTTTWFTSGIDIENIQVDNALTVYFRSVSSVKKHNGKKYAGVEFYYNVFPTKDGQITIPSLVIRVETPKEGGYKGIKRTLNTKPKTISVKPVPLGYEPQNWLVANSLALNQKWSMPLKNIKVGDVVERTINRFADGTLTEFIPATQWDAINGVSIYPQRPKVSTNKSRTTVSAKRSETVSYLFEKEGEVVFPIINYVYWNSSSKKIYKKQIDSITVFVKPNVDLVMLKSLKKSLQREEVEALEKNPFLIFGLTPKTFFVYLIIGLFILVVFVKILKGIFAYFKRAYHCYLESEKRAFNQVLKAIGNNNYTAFSKAVRVWLSKLDSPYSTLIHMINDYGNNDLKKRFKAINENLFRNKKENDNTCIIGMKKELIIVRKKYLKDQEVKRHGNTNNKDWLNPTRL